MMSGLLQSDVPRIPQSKRKNMHGDFLLSGGVGVGREQVQFAYFFIRNRDAADGLTAAVNENIAAGLLRVAEAAVVGVGIVQPEGKVKFAVRIEAIDVVKTFGYLTIAFFALRSERTAVSAERIGAKQAVGGSILTPYPHFQLPFPLKCPQEYVYVSGRKLYFFQLRAECGGVLLFGESEG